MGACRQTARYLRKIASPRERIIYHGNPIAELIEGNSHCTIYVYGKYILAMGETRSQVIASPAQHYTLIIITTTLRNIKTNINTNLHLSPLDPLSTSLHIHPTDK